MGGCFHVAGAAQPRCEAGRRPAEVWRVFRRSGRGAAALRGRPEAGREWESKLANFNSYNITLNSFTPRTPLQCAWWAVARGILVVVSVPFVL